MAMRRKGRDRCKLRFYFAATTAIASQRRANVGKPELEIKSTMFSSMTRATSH